jgi:hypothetical protein
VADCTGTAQAGFKWLNSAGFDIPESIRASYNGNISYVTLGFAVPPELAAKLPIPPAQWKTMMVYVYIANDEEQSSSFGLFHSNNISKSTHNFVVQNMTLNFWVYSATHVCRFHRP